MWERFPTVSFDSSWRRDGEGWLSLEETIQASTLTPEEIYAEKELRQIVRLRLLSSGELSGPRRAALYCFAVGGSPNEVVEEYLFIQAMEFAKTLEGLLKSVIAPFQPRV